MKALRVLYHIARADFLERVRRYSFLVTLFLALYLGYIASIGKLEIRFGNFRGIYTSAWIGTLMAITTVIFVTLAGFYIVKNSIVRDRSTRVGDILAATPLGRVNYTLGKFASNFAVLESMVVVLAFMAVVMKLAIREDPHFDLWALWAPFLFLATPAVAFTAALAVLFESTRWLRGGLGNVVYFFVWNAELAAALLLKNIWFDMSGLYSVLITLLPAAKAAVPEFNGHSFTFGIAKISGAVHEPGIQVASSFRWPGIPWTAELIASRLAITAAAALLVLVAAAFFDRFDSAQVKSPKKKALPRAETHLSKPADSPARGRSVPSAIHLTPLVRSPRNAEFSFTRMLAAELRLALQGQPWWWYAVAVGLVVAQIASPLEISRGPLLSAAWLWPVLIWSSMGVRESCNGTRLLIFSSAKILARQLPACWVAGVLVAAFAGSGAAIRLILVGDFHGVAAWIAAALFIPTSALALGIWSGSSRMFEALYTILWYLGPLNRAPGLDFTGSAGGALAARYAPVYLAITTALLVAAFVGRARQLRAA